MKKESLKQPPPEGVVEPINDALHIPIEKLEDMLDDYDYSTRNYKADLYEYGGEICCRASIEVVILLENESNHNPYLMPQQRCFVGACNFRLESLGSNQDWNATAKSMCIKNAATDIGKKFGRGLNAHLQRLPERFDDLLPKQRHLLRPDAAIVEQYLKYLKSDHPIAKNLAEIYDLSQYAPADVTED